MGEEDIPEKSEQEKKSEEKLEQLGEEIKKLAEKVLDGTSIFLVDIEIKGRNRPSLLRIYIDKPGGVTLDDCAKVSRELSDILDIENIINHKYTLEVSSPGGRKQRC